MTRESEFLNDQVQRGLRMGEADPVWSPDLETDTRLLDQCLEVARQSRHLRMKVGCVIARWFPGWLIAEVLATGYNRLPPRVIDLPERYERPLSSDFIEHAERDAIATACREGISLEGAVLYVSWHPCADCARAIINSGIREVIIDPRVKPTTELIQRWRSSQRSSGLMLQEAGVLIREGILCNVENLRGSPPDGELARDPEQEVS